MTASTVLLAELNLTAAGISLGIGGILLGTIALLERRLTHTPVTEAAADIDLTSTAEMPVAVEIPAVAPVAVAPIVVASIAVPAASIPAAAVPAAAVALEPVAANSAAAPVAATPIPAPVVDPPAAPAEASVALPASAEVEVVAAAVETELEAQAEVQAEVQADETDDETDDEPTEPRRSLPRGAEAALLSILETIPDPRNAFAVKDPTAQVRLLTGTGSTAGAAPRPRPAPPERAPGRWSVSATAVPKTSVDRYTSEELRPGPPSEWGSRDLPIIEAVPAEAPTAGPDADAPTAVPAEAADASTVTR